MNKTKIEWCDMTWNPVTGCLHGCEYCYARKMVKRFGKDIKHQCVYTLEEKTKSSYPFGFNPTFDRYRLDKPQKHKKPQNVFVCSMADLFGDWVPDEWIQEVFKACEAAPQHRYLFLTKNPRRYIVLFIKNILPVAKNMWFGTTTETDEIPSFYSVKHNTFVSIEPIMAEFDCKGMAWSNNNIDWAIIGAETGNRKGKVIPKREWIENIVENCRSAGVPVFLKDNLASVWGEPLIQEYPWKESNNGKD